jgi:hypothetical protein
MEQFLKCFLMESSIEVWLKSKKTNLNKGLHTKQWKPGQYSQNKFEGLV